MRRWLLGALLVFGCKKESSTSGLPPAQEWQGGTPPPPPSGQTVAPKSGMPNDSIHGGGGEVGAGSAMPNDSIHGGGRAPASSSPMAEKTPPQALERLPDGRVGLGPFSAAVPKEWTDKPSTSSMRAAQFVLSATPKEEAELIVYYFGEGGAGSVQDNMDRWVGQFTQPDGKPSKDAAKIEKATFAGQSATLVSVTGRYTAMSMGGAADPVDKTDQALLGAIVESPRGPYYFKLVGAKKTVDAHAARFRAMLGSLKLR
jgi:hypothetical protein